MKTLSQLNTYALTTVTFTDEVLGVGQVLNNRYQINGLLDTSKPVMENIEKMCSAAGSWLSYDVHDGKWGVVINQTGTSVASFSDANILGNISVSGTGLTDLYNSVKVEFPRRELRDSADYVKIEIPSGDRNANEPDNTLNISYDIINDPVQANLLGFIELKQSRVDLVISFDTDYSYINLSAGDIIDVTNANLGFSNRLFRIVTISEQQDESGPLQLSITALAYDDSVYSTADLYRYTRSDENGIITIGSIGIPGTPQVTKYEVDARPRVIIESTAPTGVVEGLEYWLTTDFNEPDDANRSYTLIATKKPVGGGTYASGDTVSLDYDQLNTSNFYVKTRGFNAVTVGPYSTPSGLVEFTATQVTNAIGPDTTALGGLLGALSVLQLIKSVDGLFGNDSSSGSLFKKVFDLFKDVTGVDLIGENETLPLVTVVTPSSGPLTGGTEVTISGKRFDGASAVSFGGTSATSFTVVNSSTISAVTPAHAVGPVSVLVTNSSGTNSANSLYLYTEVPQPLPVITSISPAVGPIAGGTLVSITGQNLSSATNVTFNGVAGTGLAIVGESIQVTTPSSSSGPAVVVVTNTVGSGSASNLFTYQGATCSIAIANKYPPDRATYRDPVTNDTSDMAPITGSYYLIFGGQTFYGALTPGVSGKAKLYQSDGTLVEELTANQLIIQDNVVEFPFANRELGTDYYILMDEGMVYYCSCANPAINSPTTWNFNTPLYSTTPYSITPTTPTPVPVYTPTVSEFSPNGSNACLTDIIIFYNRQIVKGAGNAYVKKSADDSLVATVPIADAVMLSGAIKLPVKSSLEYSTQYYVEADAGYVKSYTVVDCYTSEGPAAAITKADNVSFTTTIALEFIELLADNKPSTNPDKVNPQTNIGLKFNKAISFTNTGTFTIYDSNGAVKQAIPVTTNFNDNKTSELIWIGTSSTASSVLNTVWINPTKDFTVGESYYIQATATCVQDSCGTGWTGISGTSIGWDVDNGPESTAAPVTTSSQYLEYTFDRAIEAGPGVINVYDAAGNVIATFSSDDPAVTIE